MNALKREQTNNTFVRFVDSKPILDMLHILSNAGRKNFDENGAWEICLCALILNLEPQCKVIKILEALPSDTRPMDELDFLNTMANLGYFCRKADVDLNDIDARLLPGVFVPATGTPCIMLGRQGSDDLQFYDPISKLISETPSSFDKGGTVWFFQKYDENRTSLSKFIRQGSGQTWFRALLNRFYGTFAQVMTTGLILNFIALATPLFIMLVYDRVIAAESIEILPMIALGAFIAIIFEWQLRRIRSTGLSWLSGRLDNVVSNKIFSHLIGLSPDLIERASVAAQIARIKTFESVRDFFSGSVFLSLLEAPFIFLSIIAIAIIAGKIVFIPVVMIFGYIMLFTYARKKIKVLIRLAAKTSSVRQQFVIETFDKIEGIQMHGLDQKWREKYRNLSGREMMAHFHLGWLGQVSETLAHGFTIIATISTIGFGVHMIWSGSMTTGALVAVMILVWRVLTPFYSLCTMVPRLEQLRNSIVQVNNLMDIETESEEAKSYSRLTKIKGEIYFHDVGFRYGDESDYTFQSLSFQARAGDLIAITGSNGTGKATILKLIKSLHQPTQGAIRIDGFDIRQLDAPNLRRQIAYVPKTPNFFNGTIIDNMRLSNPTASEEEIIKGLELANAWDDIQKFPMGLETIIGACADVQITSSLATRLSLARAYIHPASILLIDELPNTLLLDQTGKNLKDYLARAKGKRTVIICTYREDYMKLANTIVWLRGSSSPKVGGRDIIFENIKNNKMAVNT